MVQTLAIFCILFITRPSSQISTRSRIGRLNIARQLSGNRANAEFLPKSLKRTVNGRMFVVNYYTARVATTHTTTGTKDEQLPLRRSHK